MIAPPYAPMEAKRVDKVPTGDGWQFEPKWDGFRAVIFRDGDEVYVQSKAGQPLARYFPEVVDAIRSVKTKQFVVDGEIVVPVNGRLSFDDLLQRIHPAESRVGNLAAQTPASIVLFDMLLDGAQSLVDLPLLERRQHVERFAAAAARDLRNQSGPAI